MDTAQWKKLLQPCSEDLTDMNTEMKDLTLGRQKLVKEFEEKGNKAQTFHKHKRKRGTAVQVEEGQETSNRADALDSTLRD